MVASGEQTGLLAYADGTPAGWCAVAPRAAYPRILNSRTLKPADPDEPRGWSVNCFFVGRTFRRAGLARTLLAAAVQFAADRGARVVEGYPVDPGGVRGHAGDFYTGTVSLFAEAGFEPVPDSKPTPRIVMRRVIR